MSANSTTQAESKPASGNRTATGSTSPAKNVNAKTKSPSKATQSPKAHNLTPSAKKTTRASLQNKSPEDLCSQIIELKKSLASTTDEKNNLKTRLRRLEDESNKKTESEKNSANSIINNLKRKVQRLETLVKEKDNAIKKLQNDLKTAKHSAAMRTPEAKIENSSGKRSIPENTKPTPTKGHTPSRSPIGRRGASNKAHERGSSAVMEEIKQLKFWLRRALGIDEVNFGEKYEEMNHLELIAEIHKLKEDLRLLQKINDDSRAAQGNIISTEPPVDWKAREVLVTGELERIKAELDKVKEDRADYYKALEGKDTALIKQTEELKKVQKELSDLKEKSPATRPATFVRKPSTQLGSGGRAIPGKSADASATPSKPNAPTRGTPPATQKTSTGNDSTPKRAPNGKAKMNTTTTITKQTAGVTKSSTMVIKKAPKATQPGPEASGTPTIAPPANAEGQKSDTVDGKRRVSEKEVENFRENLAAKKIQTTWKKHQTSDKKQAGPNQVNGVENEVNVREFKENRAAKVIQKGWKASRDKPKKEDELDEAVVAVQAVARGHSERTERVTALKGASEDRNGDVNPDLINDLDTSATIIQSAARAHHAREEMLQKWEGTNGNGDFLRDEASVPS